MSHDWRSRFVVRMTGCLAIPETGTYTIALTSDDGSRLILNNKTVIDNGERHSMHTVPKTLRLTAGEVPFILDYFEDEGEAGQYGRGVWGFGIVFGLGLGCPNV